MEGTERQGTSTEVKGRESSDCTVGVEGTVPPPTDEDRTVEESEKAELAPAPADSEVQQEATKTQQPPEHQSPCAQVTGGRNQPVPAPRQKLGSPVVPVPAPRTKTSQTTDRSPAAGKWTRNHFTVFIYFSVCVCVDIKSMSPHFCRSLFFSAQDTHAANMCVRPGHTTCECTERASHSPLCFSGMLHPFSFAHTSIMYSYEFMKY